MSDQLEQSLREVLSQQAAQLDQDSLARLRAVDYRPRQRRIRKLPAFGALGATGLAVAAAVVVELSSGAAPAFAGWQASPSTPGPGQLAQAAKQCGQGLGSPVLTDSRGPYTAAIYDQANTSSVCLSGDGVSMSSRTTSDGADGLGSGKIELAARGMRDSAGNGLTMVDGRIGAGVSAVTIKRSDGTTVHATVDGGWYLAWWPGTASATEADITTASGISTRAFPAASSLPASDCPAGAHCSSGYGFGSVNAAGGNSGSGSQPHGSSTVSSSVGSSQ